MESSHQPKESLLSNMCMKNLLLTISTKAGWLKWSFILLDTHTLILLMLSILPQDLHFLTKACALTCPCANQFLPGSNSDKGLIMKLSNKLQKIDSFPGANFAGMYGHEAWMILSVLKTDLGFGFVIMVVNCPIMWQSKLQSAIPLSTMEVENIVMAHSCPRLFPVMDGVGNIGKAIDLPVCSTTYHHSNFNPQR